MSRDNQGENAATIKMRMPRQGRPSSLLLLREQLLSEEQQLLQAQLGVKLSETEARLFAFACRQGGASLTDAKAMTGQPAWGLGRC